MNWYRREIFAQGLQSYLQNLGVNPDVANHVLSLPNDQAQWYVQQLRQNPQSSIEDINEVDLNIGLQGKYLPVVYGVQRIAGIPVFADTKSNASNIVYVVHALCEGEIHGLYNFY